MKNTAKNIMPPAMVAEICIANPANSWVAFNYNLQAEPQQAELQVRDAVGRVVYRTPLQATEQQHIWDTRGAASGTYTAVLLNGGRELSTAKLIVQP